VAQRTVAGTPFSAVFRLMLAGTENVGGLGAAGVTGVTGVTGVVIARCKRESSPLVHDRLIGDR
jgi:hypothetical protein